MAVRVRLLPGEQDVCSDVVGSLIGSSLTVSSSQSDHLFKKPLPLGEPHAFPRFFPVPPAGREPGRAEAGHMTPRHSQEPVSSLVATFLLV